MNLNNEQTERIGSALLTLFIVILFVAFAGFEKAQARILNQRELLARCYSHLTGQRLPAKDPLYLRLAMKDAAQVCVDLLNSVKFNANGVLTEPNNSLHRAILKQFADFHRGWFDKRFLLANELNDALWGTIDVVDPYQPSYYITRALFTDGLHYNTVLRGHENLMAVRDMTTATAAGSPSGTKMPTRIYQGGYDGQNPAIIPSRITEPLLGFAATSDINNLSFVPIPLVQVGQLIGIRPVAGTANVGGFWTKAVGGGGTLNESGLIMPLNANEAFGGGAIGSQASLILNFGHSFDYSTNGTTKLPRRWADANFKSFMCRTGPYVRAQDVPQYITKEMGTPPFRQSTSCVRCHSAMDQAAITTRNLTLGQTSTFIGSHNRISALIGRFNVTAGKEANQDFWPSKDVASFKHQAPEGKLYIRSINGDLIDRTVQNLNELGIAMSETDDYYACAASRYLEKLTGITVNLFDPADNDNATALSSLNEHDREFRNFVMALGQELRMGGSLKQMVKRIIQSDYYRRSDFGR